MLPPPADLKAAPEPPACEEMCEEDKVRMAEMDKAASRMFLFVVTVLPSMLGLAAWIETA